jgi:hypothetical protein
MTGALFNDAPRSFATDLHRRRNGSDPSAPQPFAMTLDEFIKVESDSPDPLLGNAEENLLPAGGLLIMFAKGGRGKTTATIDAVFHLASGLPWLGFAVGRPLRILIIENEGPQEPFRQKLELKRTGWGHEIAGEIFIYTERWGGLILGPESVPRLRAFVQEQRIDIIVGDPLDTLGLRGVGNPEETREFLKLLVAAGLTQDVAFWLLHHSRKADSQDELDEISGAWGGRVDTMVKIDKQDGNRSVLSFPKVRWSRCGNLPTKILAFKPEDESFVVVGEEQDDRDYVTDIKSYLAHRPWRTYKEIAAKRDAQDPGIGAEEKKVKEALEGHPAVFESRTGKDAQDLGRRHPKTVLWNVSSAQNADNSDVDISGVSGAESDLSARALALKGALRPNSDTPAALTSEFEANSDDAQESS